MSRGKRHLPELSVVIGTTSPTSILDIHPAANVNTLWSSGISDSTALQSSTVNEIYGSYIPLEINASKINLKYGNVGIGTTASTGLLHIGNGSGTSNLIVAATAGPGTVLGTSSTNSATVPQNGTAKVCKVHVTRRAGQSVMVYGQTTLV